MKKLLIVVVFFFFGWFASYRLDGFDLGKIYSPLSNQKNWEIVLDEEQRKSVDSILDQKFHYLSRGHQCFVFISEDGKYVLKFINHARFSLPGYLGFFSFIPQVKQLQSRRLQRLEPSFQSFHLAYQNLKQETGLIFLQLNKDNRFQKQVTLVDKIKIEHQVDIDKVEFMIQKKGEMIYPTLCKLGSQKEDLLFKQALFSFSKIIKNRCQKLIADDDLDVEINYGFVDEKAILIDPGRLFIDESLSENARQRKELLKSTKQFRKWLKKKYPTYVPLFEKALFSHEEFLSEAL